MNSKYKNTYNKENPKKFKKIMFEQKRREEEKEAMIRKEKYE